MKNKIGYIILGLITCVFVFSITLLNNNLNQTTVTTNSQVLSNKKIGWGIKRAENHEQPDLGSSNLKLLQEYDGIAMGNNEEKYVYLTFDNGYEAGYTSKILDTLKDNNVKAIFFITAHYLNTSPDLVKRMIDEGHIVGNHTVNHYSMPDITDEKIKEEVMNLHAALYEKFGYEMEYIRPPKGEFSERTLSVCKSLGYKTVMWSFAYDDWDTKKQGKQKYAKEKILDNVHNGEIILLHATSSDNCEILSEVIKEIKEQGYEFKSLNDFVN
ncbi:MAG: delta-lactam-biosynthetic de-N-acetylase [Clostridiales bacterium]|nr:delta-lactam-biosynthetic de-N-acetylase [Clostridiales bacterium]